MARDNELEEINNCQDVREAVGQYEAGGQYSPEEERYIIQRAVKLGCTEDIPDEWGFNGERPAGYQGQHR